MPPKIEKESNFDYPLAKRLENDSQPDDLLKHILIRIKHIPYTVPYAKFLYIKKDGFSRYLINYIKKEYIKGCFVPTYSIIETIRVEAKMENKEFIMVSI